jgi:parallel beta-helix repeat protein
MCYLINQSNIVISPPTYPKGVGYLGLVNCKNVTVQGLTLTKNGQGMLLANTTNSRITHSSVTANDNDGILLLYSSSNNTLSGNNVTANSGDGVLLGYSCDNNTLSGDHIGANSQYGIEIDSSSGNVLSSNNVTANGDGMSLYSSFGDVFVGNNITNNSNYGVYLGSSSNCTVSGNNITNNIVGVGLGGSSNCTVSKNVFASDGLLVFGSFNNTVVDNSVNGKPLVYLEGASDRHVSGAGQVVLVSCDDITVSNSNLSNAYIGTELWQTNGTIITNNKITNNYPGVLFCYSSNCTVSGNNITNNSNDGIDLEYSSNCTVLGSDITNNSGDGVYLYYSSYCVVSGSSMSNNGYNGVGLWSSSNCTISGNNIVDDMYSGVFLAVSSGNRFFHNNFVNNTQQVYSDGSPNIWDDGYPSGGNYWSNYRTAYPGAIENDSSAIWNKPYVIDTNNSDTYPLMGPFHTFSMGIWNGIAYSIDTVSNSTLSNFTFNPGAKTLTFNVTGTYSPLGFCRIRIPSSFMNCSNPDDWTVKVNGKLNGARNVIPSENCTYIYFTYPLGTEMVQITSTSAATPELQPFMLPPLFMMITLLGAMIFKRKRNAKK